MKKLALSFLALGSIVAALPAFAADAVTPLAVRAAPLPVDPFSGYIEAFGNYSSNNDWTAYKWWGAGAAGRVNWNFGPGWSLQADIAGQTQLDTVDHGYYSETDGLGALHLSVRTPSHLLGVFGGYSVTNDYGGIYGNDTAWFGGAEGQAYLNNLTLYGQVGYISQIDGYYSSKASNGEAFGMTFAQATARFFLTSNTEIEGSVGILDGNIWGAGTQTQLATWGLGVEQRFAMTPISVFARAGGFHSTDLNATENHFEIGASLQFGTATLKDRDRNGATLNVASFAPIAWDRLLDY